MHTINLEFSVETAQLRENSLFKADTLITTLVRFREALAAEAALAFFFFFFFFFFKKN